MKKCPFCAEEIQDEAIVCRHCGRDLGATLPPAYQQGPPPPYRQAPSQLVYPSNPPKSPNNALWGLLLTGLGQIVLGQTLKGLAYLGAAIVIGLMTFGIGGLVISIVAVVDAYKIGEKLQRGQPVGQWDFF